MTTNPNGKDGGFDGRDGSPYLNTAEAARYVKLAQKTLEKMRVVGGGPKFRKHGRYVRYAITELDQWSSGRCQCSTSDTNYKTNGRNVSGDDNTDRPDSSV